MLLNYHIGRLVLSSLCVGDLVRLVLSSARFACFRLQVELIEIINKPLLLHLVGYLHNCIRDARSQKHPICRSAIFWHYYELTLFSTLVR